MRGSSFPGSLVFAVLAGLASIPWMMASSLVMGSSWALGLYSLGSVAVYLVWIAPSWPRGLAAGALAALGGLAAALLLAVQLAPMPAGAVMAAATILAAVRSGFLFGGKPARVLLVEGFLVVGGLVFARSLAGASLLSLASSFWGFFLLQSLFFLVGGVTERRANEPEGDPFDQARRRAMVLMEDRP